MAVTDRLRDLFGWGPGRGVPKDRPRKGDSTDEFGLHGRNPYQVYAQTVKPPYERRRKYDIYDEMDELPTISSILDAYSEDATQNDREHKSAIWITAKEQKVKDVLDNLKQRLRWDEFIEPIARDTGKYGDDFALLDIDKDKGIMGWDFLDPRDVERIEIRQGILVGFEKTEKIRELQTKIEQNKEIAFTFKPWDIVHFRLYRRKREWKQKFRNIYGTSLMAGSERIAKQVKILDDMLMVRRLLKSLDIRVYRVDVGKSSVDEEIQILKRWKNALKRRAYIDPAAGRHDQLFDPFEWQEDLFWPARQDSQSSLEVVPGQPNVADMVDVEQFRDKLFGSLRAPKAYFGFEGDINAKATLSAQDMRWGRAVNSLQRAVLNGFTRLCQIELALHNIDPKSVFEVHMVVPSVLEDLSRLEAIQTLIDVAERMASLGETLELDPGEWRLHILRSVVGMTDQEIEKYAPDDEPKDLNPNTDRDGEPVDGGGGDAGSREVQKLDEMLKKVLCSRVKRTGGMASPERAFEEELPPWSTDKQVVVKGDKVEEVKEIKYAKVAFIQLEEDEEKEPAEVE